MPSKPAARTLDSTTHTGFLGPASPTVKVNTRDAARLSDPHLCPLTIPGPHIGGSTRIGEGAALTVLVNRKPGIAIGGKTQCGIPIMNEVGSASLDVFYDVTDTIAGLKVSQDLDGDIHVGDHITIKAMQKRDIHANGTTTTIVDDDYAAHVLADIAKIGSTDVGKQRLQNLDRSGKDVTIVPNPGPDKNAHSNPADPAAATRADKGGTGTGSDVEIQYTPEEWPPDARAESTTTGAEGDVILFHEMNHADHQTHGQADPTSLANDPTKKQYDNQEEYNSIEGDEQTYRRQRGFPERHHHRFN
jgi:uncharacterized Zn-binding protein involved in type VI secretion